MKVLWFTNTPSNYSVEKGYNGGGWISSLEVEISKLNDIHLGICFFMENQPSKKINNNVCYYPLSKSKRRFPSILRGYKKSTYQRDLEDVRKMLNVIKDYNPDIIEIFGSECSFGLISKYTDIPIVLHIQGVLQAYDNAYLPPSFSWLTYYINNINPMNLIKKYLERICWKYAVNREKEILHSVSNYIGRTEWDKRLVNIFNNSSKYYNGGEILRSTFYQNAKRNIPEDLIIVTTISKPVYKGLDLILKTANILKQMFNVDFEWSIIGNVDFKLVENVTHINHKEVNVRGIGVVSADMIKEKLLSSTVYVHTSYIDNSPNSICEAQILGVPCIATYVGGIPSLIQDNFSGYLVPSNDPYQLASLIMKMYLNTDLNVAVGLNGKQIACERHNIEHIITGLIEIYMDVIKSKYNSQI